MSTGTTREVSVESHRPAKKPRVEKVQSYLGVVSTTIGMIGAVGTAFIWAVNTFYTGTVQIDAAERPLTAVVHDKKGHEATYHTRSFELFPGDYLLEVSLPGGRRESAEISVGFKQTTRVSLSGGRPARLDGAGGQPSTPAKEPDQTPTQPDEVPASRQQSAGRLFTTTPYSAADIAPYAASENVTGADASATATESDAGEPRRRHWWQIWRKKPAEESAGTTITSPE